MKGIEVKNLDVPDEVFDRGVKILMEFVLKEEKEHKRAKQFTSKKKKETCQGGA
jgi:hypothetical protein